MKYIRTIVTGLILIVDVYLGYTQPGSLDQTFNTSDNIVITAPGVNSTLWSSALQSDGKIVIAGNFTRYNGITRNYITRLTVDGQIDATFNTSNIGANSVITTTKIQSDGKILIGGNFTSYNGVTINRIGRLNSNGTLDASFNLTTSLGANGFVYAIAIQSDGKILIGGDFLSYNGTTSSRIARLNSDGSLDASFNVGTGANGTIYAISIQSDGKILIGGDFTRYKGSFINRIARLNSDGSVDTDFNVGNGVEASVRSINIQTDGKILIGGLFEFFNFISAKRIARLNTNGSLDTGFNPNNGTNLAVYSVAIQADDKIIVGGEFTSVNGTARNRIARLNSDGSLDASFNPNGGSNNIIQNILIQTNGKIVLGGQFTTYDGNTVNRVTRINTNGSIDFSFNPIFGANNSVQSIFIQSDGKIMVGGDFTSFNAQASNRIARLFVDGSTDSTFNTNGIGANSTIERIDTQSNNKLLISGSFTSYNGTIANRIARLTTSGGIDLSFNSTGTGSNNAIYAMAIQPDDKVVIGGAFTNYNGTSRGYIARILADGNIDASFNSNTNNAVYEIVIQPDNKILIGGNFTTYNGTSCNYITRLNDDGSKDPNFNIGTGANGYISSIKLLSNGKILIVGGFTSYNSISRNRVALLNADGTLDTNFDPGTGANAVIFSAGIQSNGKILIGGDFSNYNGNSINRFARLNLDGSLDLDFNVGAGVNNFVSTISNQSDGRILIGGSFTTYNGFVRTRIARVLSEQNTAPTDISLSNSYINENVLSNATVGSFTTSDQNPGNSFTYTLVSGTGSTDNASFSIIGNKLRINTSPDYESKNSYSIRIRSTDQGLLFFEKVFTISINDICDIQTPTITPNGPTTFCSGGSVNLTSSANIGNVWSTGETTQTITVTTSGIFTVSNSIGGCSSSTSSGITITINSVPLTPGTISGIVSVCASASGISYITSTVSGATSYVWTASQDAVIRSSTSPTEITVNFGGQSSIISVTPTNGCGNGGTRTLAVSVSSSPCIPTSIFEDLETTINISPNPFTDLLSISSENNVLENIKMRNSFGETLKEFPTSTNQIQLSMSSFSSGAYIIEFVTKQGTFRKKVIKL